MVPGYRVWWWSVFTLSLVPLAVLVARLLFGQLGPDPAEPITRATGLAALQWLLLTLAMTPLRKWTGRTEWMRLRRMLGLFAFFYACLHFVAYLHLIAGWQDLWGSFTRRPYIIAGLAAFLMLLPLALTSTRAAIKALGRRWRLLHRLIYPAAIAAWIHYLWQARADIGDMVLYGAVLGALLGVRLAGWAGAKMRIMTKV
ncbi:MAG: sulfoxide reductase heme-binding subunit YedZ [Marinobacter sp.]|nr:sulfoxide reductase heme-binding subunit YedZ [Marinobacter sp.]